jgi:hypothetical protein
MLKFMQEFLSSKLFNSCNITFIVSLKKQTIYRHNFYFNSAPSPCDLILFKSSVIITLHETPHSDYRSGSPGTDLIIQAYLREASVLERGKREGLR